MNYKLLQHSYEKAPGTHSIAKLEAEAIHSRQLSHCL